VFFVNPIFRPSLPDHNEVSRQRAYTGRESDATGKMWRKAREGRNQDYGSRQSLAQVQRQLNRLRKRGWEDNVTGAAANYHPFKIYLSPPDLNATSGVDSAWRTFRVRNGLVNLKKVIHDDAVVYPWGTVVSPFNGPITETGTPQTILDNPYSCDFLLPSGKPYVFAWIDLTGLAKLHETTGDAGVPSYGVFFSDKPPAPGWTHEIGWDDGLHILLGWVDTTDVVNKVSRVRQIVDEDITTNSSTRSLFRLRRVWPDYLECYPVVWNTANTAIRRDTSTVVGGVRVFDLPTFYVAKQPKIRYHVFNLDMQPETTDANNYEVIEGDTYYYKFDGIGPVSQTDYENNRLNLWRHVRKNTQTGAVFEDQVVTPQWLLDDLIYATRGFTGVNRNIDGVPTDVGWLMVSDGRAWAKWQAPE